MRQLYESDSDRRLEDQVALAAGEALRADLRRLPKAYPVDRVAIRGGKAVAWVEIKCRKNSATKYPTLHLSVHKVTFGRALAAETGMPFVLLVSWLGDVRYLALDKRYPVAIGGRLDRGDWQDQEPVVEIPVNDFRCLTTLP